MIPVIFNSTKSRCNLQKYNLPVGDSCGTFYLKAFSFFQKSLLERKG